MVPSRPKVLIASDHAGFEMKEAFKKLLPEWEWVDLGPSDNKRVDYPDYAEALCKQLIKGVAVQGILICGSGIGMSIAANKIKGIRAALVSDVVSAQLSREHNDANVLCLGARILAPEYASTIANCWLEAEFSGGERHNERIKKIMQLESKL